MMFFPSQVEVLASGSLGGATDLWSKFDSCTWETRYIMGLRFSRLNMLDSQLSSLLTLRVLQFCIATNGSGINKRCFCPSRSIPDSRYSDRLTSQFLMARSVSSSNKCVAHTKHILVESQGGKQKRAREGRQNNKGSRWTKPILEVFLA